MDVYEYSIVAWPPSDDGTSTLHDLNALGAEGWEAIGLTTRAGSVPMPGMGAKSVPEVIVLLKRRIVA